MRVWGVEMAKKSTQKAQFNGCANAGGRDMRRAAFDVIQNNAKRFLDGEQVCRRFVPEAVTQNFVALDALAKELGVQKSQVRRVVLHGNLNSKQFKTVAKAIAGAAYTP